ncbi:MAG: hypothetical protein G3I10_04200 [Ferrovum sp.]|nr:hypothetical protein [Ferrovum sp.]
MKKATPEKSRLQGTFKLPNSQEVFGELRLAGKKSVLRLSSSSDFPSLHDVSYLYGTTLDHFKVTCIDCVSSSQGTTSRGNEVTYHYVDVFPHFVTVGDEHFDPSASVVSEIHFSVNDLTSMFYDYDAFGHVIDAKPLIDSVLAEKRRRRSVEVGEWPQIAYFTGKSTVIEVNTEIGTVVVRNRPSWKVGGSDGVFIKNRMIVSLESSSPTTFSDALGRMMTVVRFLSVLAGREQEINNIHLNMTTTSDANRSPLRVHWSLAPKCSGAKYSNLKPESRDMPLDPIHRPEEFSTVLQNWVSREEGWRVARVRYLSGLRKGNSYDANRLIGAANMFDILPREAGPAATPLPADLAASQAACLDILRAHSQSQDRDSAISAIKRMGKPSLPKKVQYRTALVERHFGARLTDLSYLAKVAVQCRNYFVHGGSDDFRFSAAEPFMSFLTDALEFTFAASDLIEAGWAAAQWNGKPHSDGHSFARFLWSYDINLSDLKRAMA